MLVIARRSCLLISILDSALQIPQMPYGVKHCTVSGAIAVRKLQEYPLMPYGVCTISSLTASAFLYVLLTMPYKGLSALKRNLKIKFQVMSKKDM